MLKSVTQIKFTCFFFFLTWLLENLKLHMWLTFSFTQCWSKQCLIDYRWEQSIFQHAPWSNIHSCDTQTYAHVRTARRAGRVMDSCPQHPSPQNVLFSGSGVNPSYCIFNKFPSDIDAKDQPLRTTITTRGQSYPTSSSGLRTTLRKMFCLGCVVPSG